MSSIERTPPIKNPYPIINLEEQPPIKKRRLDLTTEKIYPGLNFVTEIPSEKMEIAKGTINNLDVSKILEGIFTCLHEGRVNTVWKLMIDNLHFAVKISPESYGNQEREEELSRKYPHSIIQTIAIKHGIITIDDKTIEAQIKIMELAQGNLGQMIDADCSEKELNQYIDDVFEIFMSLAKKRICLKSLPLNHLLIVKRAQSNHAVLANLTNYSSPKINKEYSSLLLHFFENLKGQIKGKSYSLEFLDKVTTFIKDLDGSELNNKPFKSDEVVDWLDFKSLDWKMGVDKNLLNTSMTIDCDS